MAGGAGEDVGKRQETDALLGFAARPGVDLGGRHHVRSEVAVAEHHPFGLPGGAAGVEDRGKVFRLDPAGELLHRHAGLHLLAVADQLVEGVAALRPGRLLHRHQAGRLGHPAAEVLEQLAFFGVAVENPAAAGVGEDEGDLVGRQVGKSGTATAP